MSSSSSTTSALNKNNSDLYSILNVPSNASREEIKRSYLNLAKVLHPDKGGDALLFDEVDKAWKILGNDTSRAIYDEYGAMGVETMGVLVASKQQLNKTSIKQTLKDLKDFENEQQHNISGFVRADFNAIEFVESVKRYDFNHNLIVFPSLGFLALQQNVDFQLSHDKQDVIRIGALSGASSANPERPVVGILSLLYKKEIATSTFVTWELEQSVVEGKHSKFKMKAERQLYSDLGASMEFILEKPLAAAAAAAAEEVNQTGLMVAFSKRLFSSMEGGLQIGLGMLDSIGVSLKHVRLHEMRGSANEVPLKASRTLFGVLNLSASSGIGLDLSWLEKINQFLKLKCSLHAGTFGNNHLEVESIQVVTNRVKTSFAVMVGERGVTLKVKLFRGGLQFEFPFLLSRQPNLLLSLFGGLFPTAFQYGLHHGLLHPLRNALRLSRENELKLLLLQNRQKAKKQMLVIKSILSREEKNKDGGGLVILQAKYGANFDLDFDWEMFDSVETVDKVKNIDVTYQVMFLIDASTRVLRLEQQSKTNLLGFYDVSIVQNYLLTPGGSGGDEEAQVVENKLMIKYVYNKQQHQVVISDEMGLIIP